LILSGIPLPLHCEGFVAERGVYLAAELIGRVFPVPPEI
jgi:hypothetical protein